MEEKTIDIEALLNDNTAGDETQTGNTATLPEFQNLTASEISAVLPSDINLSDEDDLFVELEQETPPEGARLPFRLDDCQINKNQPTKYGIKTTVRVKLSCTWGNGKIFPVYENFFTNPGEPISGRLLIFCKDLFGAFNLKGANLRDLVGYEGTALITYTLAQDGITKYPHLNSFEPLSK